MSLYVEAINVIAFNFSNYCYVVADGVSKTAILIDPAWQPEIIDDAVKKLGVSVRGILITHGHIDHIHLAKEMSIRYDAPVYRSPADFFDDEELGKRTKWISSESVFYVDNIEVAPILTPGHSPGGVCYKIDRFLFTGDTLFTEGCGMCFPPEGNAVHLYDSLQRIKNVMSPEIQIFPGHRFYHDIGYPFSFLMENNIYLQFSSADQFVSFRMRPNQRHFFNFK